MGWRLSKERAIRALLNSSVDSTGAPKCFSHRLIILISFCIYFGILYLSIFCTVLFYLRTFDAFINKIIVSP